MNAPTTELTELIVGVKYEDAKRALKDKSMRIRPYKINGKDGMLSCDYDEDRVNVEISDDIVIKVVGLG
jgi:hypothetical protein